MSLLSWVSPSVGYGGHRVGQNLDSTSRGIIATQVLQKNNASLLEVRHAPDRPWPGLRFREPFYENRQFGAFVWFCIRLVSETALPSGRPQFFKYGVREVTVFGNAFKSDNKRIGIF